MYRIKGLGTKRIAKEIKSIIKRKTRFDITGYRDDFLIRRVRARMLALGINDFNKYIQYLMYNRGEIYNLINELSINVSEFFRDQWIWEKVKNIIKEIIDRKSIIRIWSAGCSKGEEPYSIAILIKELGSTIGKKVIIYATDIDDQALMDAQKGIYNYSSLKNIPVHLLSKYFEKIDSNKYKIKDSLKHMVKFRKHDLIRDPPLLFMDIIFCRNVLIYFTKELQEIIIEKFYRSLISRGYLVLGISEYLPESSRRLFEIYDSHSRIFRKKKND